MSDFGRHIHPTARKDHRCEWCGETIPKGENHTQYRGMWEGEWQNWRMHDECYDACDARDFEDGFTPYCGERPRTKQVTFSVVLPPNLKVRIIDVPGGI